MSSIIQLPDGDYLAALFVLGPCNVCKCGQVVPRMNCKGTAHVADQCVFCSDAVWHDWPWVPHPTMIEAMDPQDPSKLPVGRLSGNGAEIFQSDMKHISLLAIANEIARRAMIAKTAGGEVGNARAVALLSAANNLRSLLGLPPAILP
jgi:hypothetical protein